MVQRSESDGAESRGDKLAIDECWSLLAHATVGRMAISVRALPTVVPMQYVVQSRRLAICLNDRDIPSASVDNSVVAFCVDSFQDSAPSGWTVQLQGVARLQTSPVGPFEFQIPSHGRVLRLDPQVVGGRRSDLWTLSQK